MKKYIYNLLSDNPLCGINANIDSLNLSTGNISRIIKKVALTGDETIELSATEIYYIITLDTPCTDRNDFISSHFGKGEYSGDIALNNARFAGSPSARLLFNYDNGVGGIDNFKSWVTNQYNNNTPVTIWYVMTSPETDTISVPTGLTGTVNGYLTQSGTPTPTTPIYPTANHVTMWADYTPNIYNSGWTAATGQPEQYNGGWG